MLNWIKKLFKKEPEAIVSIDYKVYAYAYISKLQLNTMLPKNDTYRVFIKKFSIKDVSQIQFNRWIKSYCKDNDLRYTDGITTIYGKSVRYHYLKD